MEFKDQRVLITGSSRGIGLAMATRFAAAGASVVVTGRNQARVLAAADEVSAQGYVVADLSAVDECERLVHESVALLGGLDLLINNAGVFSIAAVEETDETIWDETMNANVKAAFFTSRAAVAALRQAGGVILNHGSIAGLIGLANVAAYCASKGAIVHLTRALAMELAPDIRVNCVCPTTVDNDMGWRGFNRADDPEAAYEAFVANSKLKRMPTNDDVVDAFMFLASARASFMTGVALPVDGGKSAGV
ncbi:MAG: SDR family NAD(P)-dependent oxidoreductase [Gammaproteobacteria bacterium]